MPVPRRRRLVRAAAREFASAGYEGASLNRIIRTCGMSKSSFYHVLDSKRDLFDLVIRDLTMALASSIAIPRPDEFSEGRFWATVERLFRELAGVSGRDESFVALGRMFYLPGTPDGARDAVHQALASIEAWVGEVIEVGRRSASVRDDLPVLLQSRLTFAVLLSLDEWTLTSGGELQPDELQRLLDAQLATLRRMLHP
jgi:AcrR family transcriptional regulator